MWLTPGAIAVLCSCETFAGQYSMCKSSLAAIFALLPKDRQQEVLLDCLEKMLARGEWPAMLKIIAELKMSGQDAGVRARALYLDLRCALRLQNQQGALAACEDLLELAAAGESQILACEAIFQLAGHCLPAAAEKICSLWLRLAGIPLPAAARAMLAQTGQMLARTAAQNGDQKARTELLGALDRLAPSQSHGGKFCSVLSLR